MPILVFFLCVDGLATGALLLALVRAVAPDGDDDTLLFIIPALLFCGGGILKAMRQRRTAPLRAEATAALTALPSFVSLFLLVVFSTLPPH